MRSNSLPLFLLLSLAGLLCLMPVWYFFLAPWLAVPVFYMAGEALSNLFHWVVIYQPTGTQATLLTSLQFIAEQGQGRSGKLAPVVEYRIHGYGLVMLWAMLLASRPAALVQKLLLGTGAMLVVSAVSVALQWLNEVFNRSGAHVLAQTRAPTWLVEAVEFGFHFNLFIFTALAPVLLWVLMNRPFVQALWSDAMVVPPRAAHSDQPE
ncbi:MAG: hypothetical protein I8H67_03305 [Comamonadaceae bacterium]|nr:hypothetical protein [Comamonadaceae bacterium]